MSSVQRRRVASLRARGGPNSSGQEAMLVRMRLRTILSQSLIVQSVGAAFGFFLVVVISHRFGPAGQGLYATARSWVDMASLVMLAGLPQALIYTVSSGTISAAAASRPVLVFAACVSALLWAITWAVPALAPPLAGTGAYIFLVLAACLSTVGGLYRALILARRRILLFNLVTIAPSTALFIGALLLSDGQATGISGMLAGSFGVAALLSVGGVMDLYLEPAEPGFSWRRAMHLSRFGSWSLVQQAAPQAAILGTYLGLKRGVTPEELGYFSIAMVLVSTITLPLNIVGPIFMSRWAQEFSTYGRAREFELSVTAFLVLSIAVTVVILPAVYWGVPVAFGKRFTPAIPICMIVGATTILFVQHRLLLTVGLAVNLPRQCAIVEILRGTLIVSVVAIIPTLDAAVSAWVSGEILAIAFLVRPLARKVRVGYSKVLGLNTESLLILRGMCHSATH